MTPFDLVVLITQLVLTMLFLLKQFTDILSQSVMLNYSTRVMMHTFFI